MNTEVKVFLLFSLFALFILGVNFAFVGTHGYPLGRLTSPADMPFHWGNIAAHETVDYYPPFYYQMVWFIDDVFPSSLLIDLTLVNWAFLCVFFPISCMLLSLAVFRSRIYAHYTLFLSIFGINAFNTFLFTFTHAHVVNLTFTNAMAALMVSDLRKSKWQYKLGVSAFFVLSFLSHAVGRYFAAVLFAYYIWRLLNG